FTEADKKRWASEVKIDQPFCHFEPHVSVTFPKYFDNTAKKLVDSGQQVKVLNSAPISHNVAWTGDPRKNPGGNYTLQSKGETTLPLMPDWVTPIRLNCGIHKWMSGYIWALETPYAAVSKEDGSFEITGIPAGVDVMIVTWHEASGFGMGGSAGQKKTLKAGV